MPFAGHPMVGTAYVLAQAGVGDGRHLRFEVPAGIVAVEIARDAAGAVVGGTIEAPQPLSTGETIPAETIAACVGLAPADIVVDHHQPMLASVGNPFVLAEVTGAALSRCVPDLRAFRAAVDERPGFKGRLSLHLYARDGADLRARMFAPLAGTIEDPATGSANAPLAALLLSLTGAEHGEYTVRQGVEMKRPSLLRLTARRTPAGIVATVSGRCVPVLSGEALAD
jgi:trans-2,3-dihydro-3-hydroxyanthranilate isomerase